MNKGKRELSFDVLKLFLMYLVVLGHCVQTFRSSLYYEEPLYRLIYTFHMPAFMCVAGYFSLSSFREDFIPLFRKKFHQLIVPCIAWGFLIYIFRAFLFQESSVESSLVNILVEDYWFLKSLFLCYVLFWLCKRYMKWGG